MTWHLKDRLLEKQLKKIVPNLSALIKEALDKQLCENYIGIQFDRRIDSDVLFDCRLWFFKWELVEIKDYDPYDWNEYPEITPPENTIFRVEIETERTITRCLGRTESGSSILYMYEDYNGWRNVESFKANEEKVIRFRQWED